MNRIKEFRSKIGLTQKELAKKMNTTQQTVARWEKGTSEPSITNLKDLACIFGTNIDYLVGRIPGTALSSEYSFKIDSNNTDSLDGFWGFIGVLPEKDKNSQWYPITKNEMNSANYGAQNNNIFYVKCLNNKIIIVNPDNVQRIVLNDDDADSFGGDWELDWHATGLYPLEVYDVLENINYSYMEKIEDVSESLLEQAKKIIEENKLTEDDIAELTEYIKIYRNDGVCEKYFPEDYSLLYNYLFELDSDEYPQIFFFDSEANRIFFSMKNISLIELPLNKINKEIRRESQEK